MVMGKDVGRHGGCGRGAAEADEGEIRSSIT